MHPPAMGAAGGDSMINEHLMRPGTGAVRFKSDAPVSFTSKVLGWVQGVGCHVVVLPTPTNIESMSDADILGTAIYTGRVTRRPSRLSLEFEGVSSWLDTVNTSAMERSAGTPSQWMTTLLTNGLSAGSLAGSNVTRRFEKYGQTRRGALDVWATLAGVEYEVRPDFTVDTGTPTNLFQFPPRVVLTGDSEGPDGALVGLRGSLLDQEVDASAVGTRVVVLGRSGALEGSATQTVDLLTPTGGTPNLVSVVSAPSEDGANTNALAAATLALRSVSIDVAVNSNTELVRRVLRPGDYVYLHNIASGLVGTHEIEYRGATITALRVRCTALSWPVEEGYGVAIRSNDGEWVDATPLIEWESSGAFATVGDRGVSAARAGRLSPETELVASMPVHQFGRTSVALDGSGEGSVTFPTPFGATPTVVANVVLNTAGELVTVVRSVSTSGFDFKVFLGGVAQASVTRQVNWSAMTPPV